MNFRSIARAAGVSALLLLAAACAENGGFLQGFGGADASADGGADGGAAPSGEAEAETASRAPLPIQGPGELIGRESAEVAELLGRPDFTRSDGPAEVWQYRGERCVLDVFLYKNDLGRLVEHAELRRRGAGVISDRDCVADVLAAARTGGSG